MARLIAGAGALLLALVAGSAEAQVLGGDSAACIARRGPAIEVSISGLKDRSGRLKLELYVATEADFLKHGRDLRAARRFFRRVRVATPPGDGVVTMCIRAPQPGAYALVFTHDRDGRDKFNFWRDGVGLPANRPLGRSFPELAQATVEVGTGITTVAIRAQYLRGVIPSFGPLDG